MTSKSLITTADELPNPHPGVILAEEFLRPLGLTQAALAHALGVPPRRIGDLVAGRRPVTADADLRLGRYFGLSEGFFLRLQNAYDIEERRRDLGPALDGIVPRAA